MEFFNLFLSGIIDIISFDIISATFLCALIGGSVVSCLFFFRGR